MKHLGLNFQDCSNPRSFQTNPAFGAAVSLRSTSVAYLCELITRRRSRAGWGFFGHRYQLYSGAVPHKGYAIMRRWAGAARAGHFVFTSNVDGHFLKAGFAEERVVECHGTVHVLQPFDFRLSEHLWPAADTLAGLTVNAETFLAEGPLPACPPEAGRAAGTLARPNVLMFGDGGWVSTRTEAQERRLAVFMAALPRTARVVIVEVGAGTAIPTVRHMSENVLDDFPNATLLRINPAEPHGPERTIQIAAGGKDALILLDEAIGGEAGIGVEPA